MTFKIPAIATMLVRSSERYLSEILTALDGFNEVLLLDNGLTDRTLEIAAGFKNTSICKHEFIGFDPMKNLATRLARNDWIFNIDSDEVADTELMEGIRAAVAESRMQKVFSLSRLNHYDGHLIKARGWYPDIIPRLCRRRFTQFSDHQVHESSKLPENTETQILAGRLKHYSFKNAEGLTRKAQRYSTLYAGENRYKRPASPAKALLHDGVSFMKNYFLKRGFAYGSDGLIISATNAQGSHYKYVKLYERNRHITTALVIATYNRSDALELVLRSALAQTCLPGGTIVADDGSAQGTAEIVDAFKCISPVPVKHSWRPDDGFCAAESHNRTIAAASSDYIILIDGDMLLDPSFIVDHLRLARKGRLIQGSRVILTEGRTAVLLENSNLPALLCFSTGIRKRASALHLRLPAKIVGNHGNCKHKNVKTCNMSFFRDDALTVNGFNDEFVGWGREDSKFVARCYRAGMKRHNLKFAGVAYHLWHHEAERDSLPQNDALLQQTLFRGKIRCEDEIDAFLK